MVARNKKEHTLNVRVSEDTLHAIERFAAKWNQTRVDILADIDAGRAGRLPPQFATPDEFRKAKFTPSDVIRKALAMALPFWDGDDSEMMNWVGPKVECDVKRLLAAAIIDKDAGATLRRMAASFEPEPAEPNFG